MSAIFISFRKSVRNHKVLASIAAGLLLVGVVVLIAAGSTKKPVQAAPQPLQVEVVQVEQQDVPLYNEWIGTTDGMVNADVRAQVSGYLLKKDYTEGSFVRRGQLLFEIDPRPFQAVVAQAQGNLAQSQGQVGQANAQLEQIQANLAQAHSQLLQAEAQLSQSEANQRMTQLNVDKYTPLAGDAAGSR